MIIKRIASLSTALRQVWQFLDKTSRRKFWVLIFASVGISLMEVVGISAIVPIVTVVTSPDVLQTNALYRAAYLLTGASNRVVFVTYLGGALVVYYLFRAVISLVYLRALIKFVESTSARIATTLFEKYMGLPYLVFATKNTSDLNKIIMHEVSHSAHFVQNLMQLVSESTVLLMIYAALVLVDFRVVLTITAVFVIGVFVLRKTSMKVLKELGARRSSLLSEYYEATNRSFHNFQYIKMLAQPRSILESFGRKAREVSENGMAIRFFHEIPRYTLEAMGYVFVVIVVVFFAWTDSGGTASQLPSISVFLLAMYRLLPSTNRIIYSVNGMLSERRSVEIVSEATALKTESVAQEPISFHEAITLREVRFEYQAGTPILESVNLVIPKGGKVGIQGESGSGKSTLVSIIMGVHTPTSGSVNIDGKPVSSDQMISWRRKIGYVPQSVYLFDGTVADNIVFGRARSERDLHECIARAQLTDYVAELGGVDASVGEKGVFLSGGQLQRIGIARALYGQPEILILDEATSALDAKTELQVMNDVYKAATDMTLIIIAHKNSLVERCDFGIICLNGKVVHA